MCVRHPPLFFCCQEKPRVDVRKFVKIGRPGYKGMTVILILRPSPFYFVQCVDSDMVAKGGSFIACYNVR